MDPLTNEITGELIKISVIINICPIELPPVKLTPEESPQNLQEYQLVSIYPMRYSCEVL
jgi:hypothetical protein